jgi:acyl-CoA reductase-like NAD-dependent aldehyde dehydrogenase
MAVDERRIRSIVSDVLEQLEGGRTGGAAGGTGPVGIHADLDAAVAAARSAFVAYEKTPLEIRRRVIASIRETLLANLQTLADLAVQETGLGRAGDKVRKNRLVAEKTPGTEDLEPLTWTGDHGLTLLERAPYGPIATITPVTNPSETIINNGISMIAGGNTVVFCPHPNARRVSHLTIDLMNRAARRGGAPAPLFHSVAAPTPEVAQALLRYRGLRLNVVTGGPAVVKEALAAGKKAITAGPGNPPSVVDETADLPKAARDLIAGASLDNNIICTDEKEVVAVALVADRLKEEFARAGAVVLQPHQTERLRAMLLEKEDGPRRHATIRRRFVGQCVDVLLREAGIPCDTACRLAVCEVDADHPFLWTEMMMPVLPMTRARTADDAIDLALELEQGNRHTASMHSRNIDKLSRMARECDCSIFVKNGPNSAGLGLDGEGPTSFTIASPTGEGMTTARSFTRIRRCTLVDRFRIV